MKTSFQAKRIGFLLLDGFSMIAFSNAVEVFRMANYVEKSHLYQWNVTGLDGHHTCASNGLQVQHTCKMQHLFEMDIVFICGGFQLFKLNNPLHKIFLKRLDQANIALGGICTGAYVLASADLLNGYNASLHWENSLAAQEEFPQVNFNAHIFSLDRNRFTCSGGLASIDMCSQLVEQHYNANLAKRICEQFIVHHLRENTDIQHQPISKQGKDIHPLVKEAIRLMENNINEPLNILEICHLIHSQTRTLERSFQMHFDCSPKEYYLNIRLTHAQNLLKQSSMSVSNVALACGFANASSFNKAYKNQFNYSPKNERGIFELAY